MIRHRSFHAWLALALSALAFILYLTTVVHNVGWTDTGELMAVAATFGTAHPTGYPLMTVLARAWLIAPTGLRTAIQLNLLSALLVAAATGIFFLFMRNAFSEVRKGDDTHHTVPSLLGAGVLATSLTYWVQSSSYEVYALHLLLMSAILFAYGRSIADQALHPETTSRWWLVFGYVVGLGFANHMTTVLLAPGLLWDYFRTHRWSRRSWRRIGWMAIAGFAGLSMYLVLPIRASSWPPLNWGDPSTLENLWRHISGAQYRLWMFSSSDVVSRQWSFFVGGLTGEFAWPWLVVAVWGWLVAWRRWRRMAELIGILAMSGVTYSVNYDIHEIGPYFLIVYISIALAVVPGLIDLLERLKKDARITPVVTIVVAASLIGWQIAVHRSLIGLSNPRAIERFAREVLEGVESRAVILTGRWDYLYSPALYLQYAEQLRTDVLVIDHSLLRDRSWYVEGLRRRAPWLNAALKEEFDAFARELRKFERREPFNPAVIQMKWDALLGGILREAQQRRPVYLDARLAVELRLESIRPEGFLVRMMPSSGRSHHKFPPWIPVDGNDSAYLRDFRDYLASAFLLHAQDQRIHGQLAIADSLVRIAAEYSPRHAWLSGFLSPGK